MIILLPLQKKEVAIQPAQRIDTALRQVARRTRDAQWSFMEQCAAHAPLWFCCWNKRRLPEAPDEWRAGLLSGMDILGWMGAHPDWFTVGGWDEARYAEPVTLTEAGHAALAHRDLYDMEPVEGGLVDSGWVAAPLDT